MAGLPNQIGSSLHRRTLSGTTAVSSSNQSSWHSDSSSSSLSEPDPVAIPQPQPAAPKIRTQYVYIVMHGPANYNLATGRGLAVCVVLSLATARTRMQQHEHPRCDPHTRTLHPGNAGQGPGVVERVVANNRVTNLQEHFWIERVASYEFA